MFPVIQIKTVFEKILSYRWDVHDVQITITITMLVC